MNGASLDRFLNGPFVKTGCCQTGKNGSILKIIGGLLATESQSYSRVLRIQVGENFLCLISINSPTRFARRGINYL